MNHPEAEVVIERVDDRVARGHGAMTPATTSDMLLIARDLVARGFSVFPLDHPDDTWVTDPDQIGKTPAIKWKPYQETRPTDADLVEWFGNGRKRNAAIVTGEISAIVIVDGDSAEGLAWMHAHLPPTPMRTRTWKGEHWGYAHPGIFIKNKVRIRTGDPAIKIDVRGDGGYVVAPGSTHNKGVMYEPVGTWPRESNLPAFDPAWLEPDDTDSTRLSTPTPLPAGLTEGARNDTLFTEGCRLRRLGWSETEIAVSLRALNAERCHPPLDSAEVNTIAKSCARYEPAEDTFPATETGDAEAFTARYGARVRFDHLAKRWLLYRYHHWAEQTTGDVHRLALDCIRDRQRAAIGDKGRLRWALDGERRARQSNLLAIVENLIPIADDGKAWDLDADLLGVQNGVINLRTGLVRDGNPDDRITLVSPLTYDPHASTVKWKEFVLEVCDGQRDVADYFQVVFGYALTGETGEQCFWIFYGLGANGKSTLLEVLTRYVIPRHSWTMKFPSTKWSESMSDYQRAQLVGRRLIVSKENERTQRLNTEFIKSVTGNEEIEARHPYGRPFNFSPAAKFIMAVNHKPIILDETHAMWRRVRMVPFRRTFELNPAFAESLIAEAPGVLTWAVEGAVRYYAEGITTPALVLDATLEYRKESDSLAPFFESRCVLGPHMKVRAQHLFDALRDFYDKRQTPGEERLSQKEFGRRIAADGRFEVNKGEGTERRMVFYHGVGLVDAVREELQGGEAVSQI